MRVVAAIISNSAGNREKEPANRQAEWEGCYGLESSMSNRCSPSNQTAASAGA
jgi:uncharacterized membrane protein